jgi:hypothetical protein
MTVMAIATGLHGLTDRKKGVSCLWYATLFFLLIFAILCIEVAYGVKKPYKNRCMKRISIVV